MILVEEIDQAGGVVGRRRAARICAAAHGGQILVSGGTREAARGSTPDGVRFRSLREYRLRGLPDPVPLFQVAAKGLVARFPLPRTSNTG